IDSFNDIHPYFDDNPLSGSTTYSSNSLLEEFTDEIALITYPPNYDDNLTCDIEFDLREIEFLLYQGEDSIDQTDLTNLDEYFVDPTPEMFTDEHAPDYSFPPRFNVYPDDCLEIESDADNFYDDPFDSRGRKSKRMMICPHLTTEDKVFNLGILIHEKSVKIITRVAQEKKLATFKASLVFEDFDPLFYEPIVIKDVLNSMRLLPFSSKNEEKVLNHGYTLLRRYDDRSSTMAELLRAPTEGYAEAIVVPPILAEHFELKHSLINMMTSDQLFKLEKDNTHDHIPKLTHAINQQTSVVTTAMTAILKQFQATPPPAFVKSVEEICVTCGGAHPHYQCLTADGNTFLKFQDNIQGYVSTAAINYNQGKLKAITTQNFLVLDGPFVHMSPPFINPEEDERVEETLTDLELALLSNKEKLLELVNTPLNENYSAVILKKLPEKLRDPGKFLIPCGFSELKCKALADLGASINLMPLSTARALIDVHREEMILHDSDERLTLNMRHNTSRYSNQPQKESINMINIYNDSCKDYLEDLFATNHLSGNPTFSSYFDLTTSEVKDDIFDPDGDSVLIEKLLNLDSTQELPPLHNINPLSGSTTSYSPNHQLKEFVDELALITFPPRNDDLPFDIEFDLREIEYMDLVKVY
nr:reverse transcriptase domain-containing protein [Tanacetum cinerariifolium]